MGSSLLILTLSVLAIHHCSSRLHHVKHNHNHHDQQQQQQHQQQQQQQQQQQKQHKQQQQQEEQRKTTTTFNLPTEAFVEDSTSPSPSTTPSTTATLTLKVGNRTINTNLQSALDDISPQLIGGKTIPDSATYPPNVYNTIYTNGSPNPVEGGAGNSNSTSSVIFEVLGMEPYTKEHRRLGTRLVLMTSLYGTLGLCCVLATYCLFRIIGGRQKRNKQYMLLTKRDLDFPLGGGGI
jgi:type II secretory pathway pseudopilin PulG